MASLGPVPNYLGQGRHLPGWEHGVLAGKPSGWGRNGPSTLLGRNGETKGLQGCPSRDWNPSTLGYKFDVGGEGAICGRLGAPPL